MTDNLKQPLIVVICGAFHQAAHYSKLTDALRTAGFTVLCQTNQSAGPGSTPAKKTLYDDVQAVQNLLIPYLDRGEEAILISHSYGGAVGCESAYGHSTVQRKTRGLDGGVRALVHIAANVALPGKTVAEISAEGPVDFLTFHVSRIQLKPVLSVGCLFLTDTW